MYRKITARRKSAVRSFMQLHYTDERLAQLLCHARDGKLAYYSCCCFIGIPTADHALLGQTDNYGQHYADAYKLPGAREAEGGYAGLGNQFKGLSDSIRIRILIPMIRAEMKRREKLRPAPQTEQAVAESVVHAEVVEKRL